MPKFDKRHINQRALKIFKLTGKVIACYQRLTPPNQDSVRVPTDLLAAEEDVVDTGNVSKYFIFAKYERTDLEQTNPAEGRTSTVYGNITIPYIYRAILAKTDYFDPYLNGSRFIKVGASVDDESLFIVQSVASEYLPQLGEAQ